MTLENQSSTGQFDLLSEYLKQFSEAPEPDLLNIVSKEELGRAIDRGIITLLRDEPERTYALGSPSSKQAQMRLDNPETKTTPAVREARPSQNVNEGKERHRRGAIAELDNELDVEEPDEEARRKNETLLDYLGQVRCAEYWELLQMGFSPEEILAARRKDLIVAQRHPVTHRLLLAPGDEQYSQDLKVKDFSDGLPYALGALYNSRKVRPTFSESRIPLAFLYDVLSNTRAVSQN